GYIELLKAESIEGRSTHLVARMEEQIDKARRVIAALSTISGQPRFTRVEAPMASPKAEPTRPRPLLVKRPEAVDTAPVWQPNPSEGSGSSRILLIQRSEAVMEFERSVLSALGAEIVSALTANDALDLLRTKKMDAVILDEELEENFSSKRMVSWIR